MKTLLKLAALLFVVSVLNSMLGPELTTVLMMFWTAIYCWPKGN